MGSLAGTTGFGGRMTVTKTWKINEVVTLVILAVAIGALWWGWTFLSAFTKPLKALGLSYLTAGIWLVGGTIIPFFIRKPGAAFLGETLAAGIEGFITPWGITALIWGAVQGAGAEVVFLATGYRRYTPGLFILAGMSSALFSWILDFFYSQYWTLAPGVLALQLGSFLLSGALLAGLGVWFLGQSVVRTGAARSLIPRED